MIRQNHIAPPILPLALVMLCGVFQAGYSQQRAQYTQYMFNGLMINPAYAGADGPLNVTFIQRSQWAGVKGAPSTQTLLVNSLFRDKQMGAGVSIVNDQIGVHKNLYALVNYAFHVPVARDQYLSMGVQAGVNNSRSDYRTLTGDLNNDPNLSNPLISESSFEFGAGIYFRSQRFHIGFSAPTLIPEKLRVNDSISIDLANTNYFLFSKYHLRVNEAIALEPGLLIKYLPRVPFSFDVNLNAIFHKVLTAGVSYRKSESVDFISTAQVTPQLKVGYAYDHPVGVMRQISNGSHELMVSYLFRFVRSGVKSPR